MKKYIKIGVLFVAMVMFVSPMEARAATVSLMPTGDLITQWRVVGGGPSHFSVVDDNPCNGAADYVATPTLRQRELFEIDISSVPAGSTITDISISPCASKLPFAGTSTLMVDWSYSAIASGSDRYSVSNSFFTQLPDKTWSGLSLPRTGAPSEFLHVGAMYEGGNAGLRMSNYRVTVTYN